MDVVKFIKERNRMCKSVGDKCTGCPAFNEDDLCCCAVDIESTIDATAQVAIVEKWAVAHPLKTRQSVFLEQYPEAYVDKEGLLQMCPTRIVASHRLKNRGGCAIMGSNCKDCRKAFWTEEVQ